MENVDKIKRGEPVKNPDKIVKAHMAADAARSLPSLRGTRSVNPESRRLRPQHLRSRALRVLRG